MATPEAGVLPISNYMVPAQDAQPGRFASRCLCEIDLARIRGRTSFIIAHRLATFRHVDRIIVIAGGRVVESGTHAELQAMDGVYRRLAALQFRE